MQRGFNSHRISFSHLLATQFIIIPLLLLWWCTFYTIVHHLSCLTICKLISLKSYFIFSYCTYIIYIHLVLKISWILQFRALSKHCKKFSHTILEFFITQRVFQTFYHPYIFYHDHILDHFCILRRRLASLLISSDVRTAWNMMQNCS